MELFVWRNWIIESNKSFGFNWINERVLRKCISSLINWFNFVWLSNSRENLSGSFSVDKRRIFSKEIVGFRCLDFDSLRQIDVERCFLINIDIIREMKILILLCY
jgi:hypothetical protein